MGTGVSSKLITTFITVLDDEAFTALDKSKPGNGDGAVVYLFIFANHFIH